MNKKQMNIPYKRIGFVRDIWVISRKEAIELANKVDVYYYCTNEEVLTIVENASELNSIHGDNFIFFIKLSEDIKRKIYKILDKAMLLTMFSILMVIVSFSVGFTVCFYQDQVISNRGEIVFYSVLSTSAILSYLSLHCLLNYGSFGSSANKASEIAKEYIKSLRNNDG